VKRTYGNGRRSVKPLTLRIFRIFLAEDLLPNQGMTNLLPVSSFDDFENQET